MFILVSHARIYKIYLKYFILYTKIAQNNLEKYYVQKSDYNL